MLNGFTAQHNDKRLATVGIDIGNGVAKALNQFGAAFLHGKPSLNYYSFNVYFYSFIALGASGISPYLSPVTDFFSP